MTQKVLWWILGLGFAIVLSVSGTLYTNMRSDIHQLSDDIKELRRIETLRGERVAALEAQAIASKDTMLSIKNDIDYIKRRVDELVKR